MANETGTSGLPLDQFSRQTPPGWHLGDSRYPVKRFLEVLKLWHATTDCDVEKRGPAVAGRLVGRLQKVALEMRLTKQDGTVLVGVDALSFPGEAAQPAAVQGG